MGRELLCSPHISTLQSAIIIIIISTKQKERERGESCAVRGVRSFGFGLVSQPSLASQLTDYRFLLSAGSYGICAACVAVASYFLGCRAGLSL